MEVIKSLTNETPISIDLIENNLYLGNIKAAWDTSTLVNHNITHVVTVDVIPLPRHIQNKLDLKTLQVPVKDSSNEDLLSHFENVYKFITEGVTEGSVLVYCSLGISRSSSVVIAYLMKKYNYTYRAAFKHVKEKRTITTPNAGFVWQLQLYHDMKCNIDKNHMKYKVFRLKNAADKIKERGAFPLEFLDVIKPDPDIVEGKKDEGGFRCRLCERLLVGENNIITHMDPTKANLVCTESPSVEPLAWMEKITKIWEGKLNCPKCYHKVGIYSWITKYQCPCGSVVSPIFLINRTSVYWSSSQIDK